MFQAEIDAACELIDFFTFNVQSALELEQSQPLSPDFGITNKIHYRAREGFVAAISPFNFTAIGGNLAGTPGRVRQSPIFFVLNRASNFEAQSRKLTLVPFGRNI